MFGTKISLTKENIEKSQIEEKSIIENLICIPMSNNFDEILINKSSTACSDNPIFIFDIDNTLYKQENGMHDNILESINNYAKIYIKDEELAKKKVLEYYNGYGLTIKGFLKEFEDATVEKWNEIYDANLHIERYLHPDAELQMLLRILRNKNINLWCLTNGSKDIGLRMLKSLYLVDYFDGMIYCDYTNDGNFICKPSRNVYDFITHIFNIKNTEKVYIFEDRVINLEEPKKLGWNTYYINEDNCIKKVINNILKEQF